MKKNLLFISILLFVFSALVMAQPFEGKNNSRNFDRKGRLIQQLNLTTEQQKKIDDLRFNHQNKMIELKAQLQKNKLEMGKTIKSGNLNKSDYLALVNKNNDLKSAMNTSRAEMFLNIYSLLDDEQKVKFTEMKGFQELRGNKSARKGKCGSGRRTNGKGNFNKSLN
ncbi:MAG: Spy/CpxP family protein refolding chaperone [Bacteroidetes bacterium]|jgi:Spy/CpxP family protein refolding chaperone|nr:Spy/CpxP family protein refolding chaperone [Bacteroidota bacterium]